MSAMMLMGAGLSATGVSTAGGVIMLASPVPAIVGISLGVAAHRAAVRAR